MPRPAVLTVAAVLLASLASLAGTTSAPASPVRPGQVAGSDQGSSGQGSDQGASAGDEQADPDAEPGEQPSSTGADAGPGSRNGASPSGPREGRSRGRTPYERRHVEAREDSLTIDPVTRAAPQRRPNILVIMADDMREDDLQFMPNVQRLIGDEGVRFKNTFSPHPLCCPARASFLSALYTHNHGVWSHRDPYGFRVFDDRQTLPVWLHNLGYSTTFLGKYLNGYGSQTRLDGSPSTRYVPPGWTDWRGSIDSSKELPPELRGGTYRYFDSTLNDNGRIEPHQGAYQTHLYSKIGQRVIREHARSPQPFFAYLSFVAPHKGKPNEVDDPEPYVRSDGVEMPLNSPARPPYVRGRFDYKITSIPGLPDKGEDFSTKPFFIRRQPPLAEEEKRGLLENYRQRAETVSILDDEVANIFATLRKTGELDNTYVMFVSDNGFFLGEHRRRQGKILPYEPSLRVPLLIRGPGLPAGEVRTDPVTMIDLAPTMVQMAGGRPDVDTPEVDGVGLLDMMREGDSGWTRGIVTETGPRTVSPERSGGKGVPIPGKDKVMVERFSTGLRTGRYLYVEHANGERELYDQVQDPRQLHSIVDDPGRAGLVRLLERTFDRLKDCDGRECAVPLPRRLQMDDAPTGVYPAPDRRVPGLP